MMLIRTTLFFFLFFVSNSVANDFVTVWDINSTNSNQIRLPLIQSGYYNFTVDWGDGTQDIITSFDQAEVTQ